MRILKNAGYNVPSFITVTSAEQICFDELKGDSFAVRSSFSCEDGERQSFAGQFDTFLQVPKDSLNEATRKVLASVNKAEDYAEFHGLTLEGTMEVIIQEMVEAELSAVLFTGNPQGLLNEGVLTIGKGLGTGIVSDQVPTRTYYYNLSDGNYYYESQEGAPSLSEEMVREIFITGEKIQNQFGMHMDIELSIANGKVYILQARPVTGIEEGEDIVLDNSNISESYPGISLPATQSFAKEVYYHAFKSCVEILAGKGRILSQLEHTFKNMVSQANGRMYYQISNWYSLLKVLPFSKKIIPMWQEMLGVSEKTVVLEDSVKPTLSAKIKIFCTFTLLMVTTPKKMKYLNDFFLETFPKYKEKLEHSEKNEDLITLYKEARDDIGAKWGITLINDMYAFIYTSLAKRKQGAKIGDIQRIESLKPVMALEELAISFKEFGIDSDEYKKAEKKYLMEFGDRCFEELKLETHTMNTHPEVLKEYIMNYELSDEKIGLNPHIDEGEGKKDSYFVRKAKLGIYNRELSRMNRTRLFGFVREILRKVGKNLVEEKIIKEVDDVFWLYIEELEGVCRSKKSLAGLIEDRKEEFKSYKRLPAYSRLIFRNKIKNKIFQDISVGKIQLKEGKLKGTPSSSGIVRGEALLVTEPSLEMDSRGKILIADITDPGWVFLIKNAKGIVAQRGSILSHTAIITRELKKPSVVGVSGALSYIKSGDYLEINGDTGIIEIINPAGEVDEGSKV